MTFEQQWAVELRAAELFRRDYPTGRMKIWLPQFRPSRRDPIGDAYRAKAQRELGYVT